MAIRNILLAEDAGLGHGETPIFPIHIFKVKEGVNYNPGDPNYDLFELSMKVTAKRLFPNYVFLDSPSTCSITCPATRRPRLPPWAAAPRVMGNVYDPSGKSPTPGQPVVYQSINLPRLAILSAMATRPCSIKSWMICWSWWPAAAGPVRDQAAKRVYNYPFLMGQGVWLDSDTSAPTTRCARCSSTARSPSGSSAWPKP